MPRPVESDLLGRMQLVEHFDREGCRGLLFAFVAGMPREGSSPYFLPNQPLPFLVAGEAELVPYLDPVLRSLPLAAAPGGGG